MKQFLFLAYLVIVVLAGSSCRADQMADDFAWFDTLGFHDVKGLPFVRFTDGWFSRGKQFGWQPGWSEGFVLQETPEKYRILTLNFETQDVLKGSPVQPGIDFGTIKNIVSPLDLRTYSESTPTPDPRHAPTFGWPGAPNFPPRASFFVLAWACHRNGLDDEAARLYAKAQMGSEGNADEVGWNLHRKLERDFAVYEIWSILLDFGNPEITRPQLLARLEHFMATYPRSDHFAKAKELADELKIMIAEDASHPKRTTQEIAKLPPAERAQEWIFRLRDQNGHQMSQPGGPDVFDVYKKGGAPVVEKSPAEQLLVMGDEAVPPLIAALGDQRLTRTVGFGRDFVFSHEVMTVGVAARQVLERMANRAFPGDAPIEAWWKTRHEKGEEAEAAEATARGDENSPSVAYILIQKYPAQAAAPILAGVKTATNHNVRSGLVALAAQLKPNPVPDSFLLEKAAEGQPLESRIQAAYDLAGRGNLEAIPALARLWPKYKSISDDDEDSDEAEDTRQELIGLLAAVDSPVGIEALGHGLRKCAAETRETVLEGLDIEGMSHVVQDFESPPLPEKFSAATQAAAEALLGAELTDIDAFIHFSALELGNNPPGILRLADYAAFLMSHRWPDRYQFNPRGSLAEREKQRLACVDTWRKRER